MKDDVKKTLAKRRLRGVSSGACWSLPLPGEPLIVLCAVLRYLSNTQTRRIRKLVHHHQPIQ
jgi:hypothetical protein